MSLHTCERCGQIFEYNGNVRRCPTCRVACSQCGDPVSNYNDLCEKCRYHKRKDSRLVNCAHPGCANRIRKEKGRSGFCRQHTDWSATGNRIAEYNRTIKKVTPGLRLGQLGLRTDETPFIITICEVCNTPYLASPGSLRKETTRCCSPECVGVNAAKNTPNHDTAIERAIEQAIRERGWMYEKQVPLAGITIADFYLPEYNTVVYCDGDFWHADQESKERDSKQVNVLTSKGYNVFRFTETEINRSAHDCLDQIAHSVVPLFRQLSLPIS